MILLLVFLLQIAHKKQVFLSQQLPFSYRLRYQKQTEPEFFQLSLTFDPERKAELEEEFNQHRLEEIEKLIEQNRAAVIQFKGILETKGENLWIVEDHTIFLPNDISIEDEIVEGAAGVAIASLLEKREEIVGKSCNVESATYLSI